MASWAVGAAAQISTLRHCSRCGVEMVAHVRRDPRGARVARSYRGRALVELDDSSTGRFDRRDRICTPNSSRADATAESRRQERTVERPFAAAATSRGDAKAAKKVDSVLACAAQHRFRPDAKLCAPSSPRASGRIYTTRRAGTAAHRGGLRRMARQKRGPAAAVVSISAFR